MTHRFMMFEFALNVATNKGCLSHIEVPHHNHLQVPITIPWNTEQRILKGRGPGINSSQSKNVGKIQLSMQLSHLSIIFENTWF